MTLRQQWEAVKKKTGKVLGKFYGHADLGPSLDSAEKAEAEYKKLPGNADEAKQKAARRKVYDAYSTADKAVIAYLKITADAQKANAGNKDILAALEEVNNVLAMKIADVVNEKLRTFKPR